MTTQQPEALRLAHWLERNGANCQQHLDAAAELRRLHEAHEWQYTMAGQRLRRIEKLEASNQELVKALEEMLDGEGSSFRVLCEQARAAIAKAERTMT